MSNGTIWEMPIDYVQKSNGLGTPVYADIGQRVRVQFIREWEVDPIASEEAGREIKKERLICLKQAKGDTNITSQNVTDWHKRNYAAEWEAFCNGGAKQFGDISELGLGVRQIAELRYSGINTIKELADAEEEVIKSIPEYERCIAKAKLRLSAIEYENEQVSAIIQVGDLKRTVAEQSAQLEKSLQVIEELKAKLGAEEKPKRKRGRPRKVKAEESE